MVLSFDKSNFSVFLAPMAGVTDRAFRAVVDSFGSSAMCSEMVSAKALVYGDKKTFSLMERDDYSAFYGVQIFGHEPDYLAEAARIITNVDFIDINMGCPAAKIIKNNDGGALLKNVRLIEKIVKAVRCASSVPVTVKIRSGFDSSTVNAVDAAKAAEAGGASAVCVHPRTVKQQYSGKADYSIIGKVSAGVSVPVIGSGDVICVNDAARMVNDCGVSAVMIGRAALGRPWFLKEVMNYLSGSDGGVLCADKFATAEKHLKLLAEFKGETIGMLEARKHISWYFKGENGASALKQKAHAASTLQQMLDIIGEARERSVHAS